MKSFIRLIHLYAYLYIYLFSLYLVLIKERVESVISDSGDGGVMTVQRTHGRNSLMHRISMYIASLCIVFSSQGTEKGLCRTTVIMSTNLQGWRVKS